MENQNSVSCVLQLKLLPFFNPEIPQVLNKWIDLVVVSGFVLTLNLIAMSQHQVIWCRAQSQVQCQL